jgi:DNA-directed RNA polymerase subunit RPC12/RpoP
MEANVNGDSIELLCNHCGQTFSAFLHQMAEKNAKVVCPNCREGDGRPVKAGPRAAQTVKTRTPKKIN